jgi:type I restriction enzyme S subunit
MNLLDVCKIGGSSVKKFDGEKKYIATGDINDNRIVSFENVTYKSKPSRANVEIKSNDVLFAKMMDTIKVLKADETNIENIYSTGFYCMTPNSNVLQDYLYLYFKSDIFNSQKNKNCSGATQKAINNDGLTKITIKNIPAINEQKIIVKKLFNIDNLIRIKKEEIEKMNLLIKSQFVERFGDPVDNTLNWKVAKIGEICFVTKLA